MTKEKEKRLICLEMKKAYFRKDFKLHEELFNKYLSITRQTEFNFVDAVEREQVKKQNDRIIKRVVQLQEYQKKFPKFDRYLRIRINNLLENVR